MAMKVPLNVGWLSEEGLLDKAAIVIGYTVIPDSASEFRVGFRDGDGKDIYIDWEEYFNFTVAQLLEFGFESGEFKYCPCCKKLQVDCDKEQAAIDEHNKG